MKDNKLALLAIERELSRTPRTAKEFVDILDKKYDLQLERKTVYSHLNAVTRFMNVCVCNKGYYLGENR